MPSLSFNPRLNALQFFTAYNPDFVANVKNIPGRKWHNESKAWTVPSTESIAAIKLAKEYEIPIDDNVNNLQAKIKQDTELASAVTHVAAEEIIVPGVSIDLRPYQKVGVAYLASKKRAILADEMGTGKTLMALSTVATENKWPVIVVCPASLRINWQREVAKFFPGKTAAIIGLAGEKKRDAEIEAAKTADVVIVNYDILAKTLPMLDRAGIISRAGAMIADEAHYVKDLKSQRGEAVFELSERIKENDGLIVLATGTPVINKPKDLISPLRIIGTLDTQFGGYPNFVKRYCDGYKAKYGWCIEGATNLKELEQKLRATGYIRRTKDQVLTELPDKQRSAAFATLSDAGKKEYVLGEKALSKWVSENAKELSDIAGGGYGAEVLRRIGILRQLVGHNKITHAAEISKNIVESGEKVIVFAVHKEVQQGLIDSLSESFPGQIVQITGDMDSASRQRSVDAFQSGRAKAIVCSQKAGGVGLTLTAASNVVFAEYDWTAASHDQAEDRAHRIGQKNAVNCWYVHAPDTIDDAMAAIVDEKREMARQVTGDKELSDDKKMGDVKKILAAINGRCEPEVKKGRSKKVAEPDLEI